MAQGNDDDNEQDLDDISSGLLSPPLGTSAPANQSPLNLLPGLGLSLVGQPPTNPTTGLAADLGAGPSLSPQSQAANLAGDLTAPDLTSAPGLDPRLKDVTVDPGVPSYMTKNGTIISMNHPAPRTVLPWGAGLDHLIKFADAVNDETGLGTVKISGGAEGSGHSLHSAHAADKAIDVSGTNDLFPETVRQAALAAGYTHGVYEIRRDGSAHWHLQVGADNFRRNQPDPHNPDDTKDPDPYNLNNGPIKVRVYTPDTIQPTQWGRNKILPLPTNADILKPMPLPPAGFGGG